MRRFLSLVLLPVLSLPVPAATLSAWAADPPVPDAAPAHHPRLSWEDHFTQANLAHDGHLTLADAKAGYPLVAKNFEDIDADHKGYVTENDVKAWRVIRRAARRLNKPHEDKLRPRTAFQRVYPKLGTTTASARQTAASSGDMLAVQE